MSNNPQPEPQKESGYDSPEYPDCMSTPPRPQCPGYISETE